VVEQAAETLIQVHGGIGFTWEHDAHLFWRRAKVDRLLLGDDVSAYDTVARLALGTP
jgi:alkylation response protein AidB-like acyl-CoA dehydrogenase